MTEIQEKAIAGNMLALRQQGCSVRFFVKRSLRRYILFFFAFLLIVGGCVIMPGLWPFGLFSCGMLFGASLRDVGWFRVIVRQWPLTAKITDWKVVETIAGESGDESKQ